MYKDLLQGYLLHPSLLGSPPCPPRLTRDDGVADAPGTSLVLVDGRYHPHSGTLGRDRGQVSQHCWGSHNGLYLSLWAKCCGITCPRTWQAMEKSHHLPLEQFRLTTHHSGASCRTLLTHARMQLGMLRA